MRLIPIPPDALAPATRALHDDMAAVVAARLRGFVSSRPDGALVGPFAPMLRFPQFGGPAWAFTRSLIDHAALPSTVREVAILKTGACFGSRYELYAHERVATAAGLPPATVATITAGERPADLGAAEAVAYDVAAALAGGRQLPGSTWQAALGAFGEDGAGELVFLIGAYALVSTVLNGFDMPVPDEETA